MTASKIPLPWSQRFRVWRTKVLPLITFAVALLATVWLWSRQSQAVQGWGEVHAPRYEVTAPITGELIVEGTGQWKLYDYLEEGAILGYVQNGIERMPLIAPASGYITELGPPAGQVFKAGTFLCRISPERGDYILGYLRDQGRTAATQNMPIMVRTKSTRREFKTHIEKVGPAFAMKADTSKQRNSAETGTPVRIAIPREVTLQPGELVELFAPAAEPLSPQPVRESANESMPADMMTGDTDRML